MLKKIFSFLKQPYPDREGLKSYLVKAIVVGVVVFFILYALQPFSIHLLELPLFTVVFIYGLISSIITFIYSLFQRYILQIEKDKPTWTYGTWLLSSICLILLIATANYLITFILFENESFVLKDFMYMMKNTFIIGVFPITIFGALSLNKRKRENELIADKLNQHIIDKPAETTLSILNNKMEIVYEGLQQNVLYLEAMQNYVVLHYLNQGINESTIIRNTLKNIEQQLKAFDIVRCHRSFIVNKKPIKKIQGNAQGLKLELSNCTKKIPVSRKYFGDFKALNT